MERGRALENVLFLNLCSINMDEEEIISNWGIFSLYGKYSYQKYFHVMSSFPSLTKMKHFDT